MEIYSHRNPHLHTLPSTQTALLKNFCPDLRVWFLFRQGIGGQFTYFSQSESVFLIEMAQSLPLRFSRLNTENENVFMSRFTMPRIRRLVVPGHPHHVTQLGFLRQSATHSK